MKSAGPEVKAFATPLLKKTYGDLAGVLSEPNTGAVMNRGAQTVRSRVGAILRMLPEGEDFVKQLPRTTLASYVSGKESDMYVYNGTFTPNAAMIGTWAWAIWPTPANPSEIDARINAYMKGRRGKDPTKVDKPKDML